MIRRVACALLVGGLLETGALAQTPPPLIAKPADTPPPAAAPSTNELYRGFRDPLPTDPAHPDYHPSGSRSILRYNPLPYRTSYQANPSNSSSSRNNGSHFTSAGVGRAAEYYDDRTLNAGPNYHQNPVGNFDSGGGPNRAEQLQAQQNGAQRTANIQNNINAYGRPYGAIGAGFGYGMGLGGFGGYN